MQKTKKFLQFSFIVCTMFTLLALLSIPLFAQSDPRLEVIVMFEPGAVTHPDITAVFLQHNIRSVSKAFPQFSLADTLGISRTGEQVRLADLSNLFILKVPDTSSVQVLINSMSKLSGVVYIEPNFHDYRAHGFPNDPHYENGDQWGLNNYGQNGGTNDADIDAPEAWQITTGSNVLIGVIDDGVDAAHEDLSGKVGGDAGVYGGNQSWPFGHGTHVSGIAAAIGNNTKGIAGVNWAATINSQRVENGSNTHFYNSIMDAVNAGSKILNNSWGGYSYSSTIRLAFANAYKLNVVSVASMGNDNTSNVSYPAGYGQGIISVGASDRNDIRSLWLYGRGSNYGNHIDVVAPGTDIWSTFPYTNNYVSWDGTSMAAPFVSGIASLLLSVNPNLYNDDIEQIIRISADEVAGMEGQEWTTEYGTGRVNAKKALEYLQAPYTLLHKSTSGGSEHSHTGYFLITFYGVPGIANGTYFVKRYDVRKTVNWSETLEDVHVWGRGVGVGTNGYSLKNPNFAMGWCEVISNNSSSATLRTYVYDVWERGTWRHVGWKPTSPSNVSFNYTVFGEEAPVDPLSVTITGPSYLPFKASGICTANVSGGTSPISYQWYKKIGQGSWISLGTSSTQSITMGMDDITMKVVVTDNYGLTDEDTHLIETGIFKLAAGEESTLSIPDNHIVAQNYPNPFNPETQIRFGLPEDSKVTIEVFNLQGQKVATLADGYYEAGYHSVTFRCANHPSGVYFYRTVAGEFHDIKRMLLIK